MYILFIEFYFSDQRNGVSVNKHWIDISQSDGITLALFNKKYTIHLVVRKGENWRDVEKDAEFIIDALKEKELRNLSQTIDRKDSE